MLDLLCKVTAAVIHRVVQEYRALEDEFEIITLGLADDDDIGADDPEDDVYASRVGFSPEQGRLKKEG
jgi:hypothetical protein